MFQIRAFLKRKVQYPFSRLPVVPASVGPHISEWPALEDASRHGVKSWNIPAPRRGDALSAGLLITLKRLANTDYLIRTFRIFPPWD